MPRIEFGLINMNGRLYDPVIGRMLSVDNYAGLDGTSQSYNRYSYVSNNPLMNTDPSGEFALITDGLWKLGLKEYVISATVKSIFRDYKNKSISFIHYQVNF